MELAEKLRLLRYSYDYSKAYVAYKLDIPLEDYIAIETGQQSLTLKQIEKVSDLYHLKSIYLVERDEINEDINWQALVGNSDRRPDKECCEYSMTSIKCELANIKEMLHTLVEKLGIS